MYKEICIFPHIIQNALITHGLQIMMIWFVIFWLYKNVKDPLIHWKLYFEFWFLCSRLAVYIMMLS